MPKGVDTEFYDGWRIGRLDAVLDVPDEGADAHQFGGAVELAELGEDGFYFFVGHYGDDGRVERWPGVGAVMGFAGVATATDNGLPTGETAHVIEREDGLYLFVIGLIESDKYGFHTLLFFL